MTELTRRRWLHGAAAGGALAGAGGWSALSAMLAPLWPGQSGIPDTFQPPSAAGLDDASHVLNRLTFGPRPGDHARVTAVSARAFIAEQLEPESIDDDEAELQARHFDALDSWPLGELLESSPAELLDQLTRAKIQRVLRSRRQLFEVMVDFWSDHFNIDPSKGDSRWFKPVDDRTVIRRHALGRFPALVKASALSPSMLWYLDGRVNRRARATERPNENYARELLELHTLGVHGGYTQQDVMEVARCLTGWTVRDRQHAGFAVGKVEFRASLHDDGPKTVLGTAIPAGLGKGDLDRVLEIVVQHPSTARYLAEKLCRRFIAEDPPGAAVKAVTETFAATRGDIRESLRTLFGTEAFWRARGEKIKRPFHFIASALRATGARTDAGRSLQDHLLRMGHAPFQYPTPDGYPEEAQPWMATLLWRWRFALDLASNSLKGTSIEAKRLRDAAGGETGLAAHLLGRQATEAERVGARSSGTPLALLIASPGFQLF